MIGPAPNHNSQWTELEVRRVLELKAEGRSVGEIADRIGRTRNAVLSVLLYPRRGGTYDKPDKPEHVTAAQFTADWWQQNNAAFVAAMRREYPEHEIRTDDPGRFPCFDNIRRVAPAIDAGRAHGPSTLADMAE